MLLNENRDIAKPDVSFEPKSRYALRQLSGGIAYRGQWGKRFEISAGVQKTDYRKEIALPGLPTATTVSRPWLYNATIVGTFGEGLAIYAGSVNGLEENVV